MIESKRTCIHRRIYTGPLSFRGAEVCCPNIFSIACPKIKWFCPKMAIEKIYRGLRGLQPLALALPPRTPICLYMCYFLLLCMVIINFAEFASLNTGMQRIMTKLTALESCSWETETKATLLIIIISPLFNLFQSQMGRCYCVMNYNWFG